MSKVSKEKKAEYVVRYRLRNKDKVRELKRKYRLKYKNKLRSKAYKASYGITLEDYNELFKKQDGRCKCCGVHQTELKRSLSIDHDHSTGRIRGLLCNNCNVAIGHVKESAIILQAIINYLSL